MQSQDIIRQFELAGARSPASGGEERESLGREKINGGGRGGSEMSDLAPEMPYGDECGGG